MTLNEIASELEKIPPEAMKEIMSSVAEDMQKEADKESESLVYDEIDFFDPNDYDYNAFEWDENYDPLADHEVQNMPEIPNASVPEYTP